VIRCLTIALATGLAVAVARPAMAAEAAPTAPAGGATAAAPADITAAKPTDEAAVRPTDSRAGGHGNNALLREVRANRARLFSSQIAVTPPATPSVNLEEAMRRLREAVARPVAKPKAPDAGEVAPTPEPATTSSGDAPAPSAAPVAAPILSEEELARVKNLSLERLREPIALADALFLGGHPAEAAVLYERLLADGALRDMDRAWALYQAANCKRQGDASAALVLYDRLLTEHPESPWVEPAKVRKTLLQWQTQTQPQTLLALPADTAGPSTAGPVTANAAASAAAKAAAAKAAANESGGMHP